MSLALLPAELQLEVFSYLDNASLKAARAVSRKLRDNASPALFRSVVACARYDALGAFQKISLDSVLQKYVKEIVFDGSIYDAGLADHEYAYEQQSNEYENLRLFSFWGKRTRWRRYKELYIEQEDLQASGVLLQTISRALDWTTNVTNIVYSPHPHLIPVEEKVVRDLMPRGVKNTGPRHMRARDTRKEHPFRLLIGALYLSRYTGIRELRIEALRGEQPGTPFTFADFDFPDTVSFQAGKHLFQNLERCELNITCWSREVDIDINRKTANLSKMLFAAEQLRHLNLHVHDLQRANHALMAMHLSSDNNKISSLGLQNTWPKLRSLSLGGFFAEGEQLLDLIRRHRCTLTSLLFRRCSLFQGTWADIVDEVVYGTSMLPFILDSVNETTGMTQSNTDMEEWRYEGHIEVTKDGERNFVDVNPAKMSVYHVRNM